MFKKIIVKQIFPMGLAQSPYQEAGLEEFISTPIYCLES